MRRILAEQQDTKARPADTPKKVRKSEDIHFEDAAAILGEDGMAAIASTLSAFRSNT